ncbi:MAG: T9SS type A sorting domain-containing protein [Bacteroidales bacterium]|nr:T9SS type A sorting domain-containing protein [Bacteroidales bacterium]
MKKIGLKIVMLIVLVSLINYSGFSQNNSNKVSIETAIEIGQKFMPSSSKAGINAEIKYISSIKNVNNQDKIHVLNFVDGGFILISGDNRAVPVLAFADEGEFDFDTNIAPATKMWINQYLKQLDMIEENNYQASPQIEKLWEDMLSGDYRSNSKKVDQLLQTRWNQDWPYNMFTPEHPEGSHGHTYAGCVATAMAQIMKYWEYPDTAKGIINYHWGQYYTVDLNQESYDYSLMPNFFKPNSTTEEKEEVARLMFHCGIAVNMNYGYESSGSQTAFAWEAFKSNFKYRSGSYFIYKEEMSDAEWKFKLKYDLDLGRPIMYAGVSEDEGGHAFVCDGYKDTSFFRFNWGWGGYKDGYFYLDNINPQTEFPIAQSAIFELAPYGADFCKNDIVMVLPSYSFDDGSGPNLYANNTNCSWLINPDMKDADFLRLSFNRFDLAKGDTLTIWKGNTENGLLKLVGKYTGSNNPGELTTNSNKFYLEFTTDGQGQAQGFQAHYETVVLGVNENTNNPFRVYPNPTSSILQLEGLQTENITIMDISGKTVLNANVSGKSIDVSNLKPGLYIIKADNQFAKFIKE